jgi:predicted ribosomally synthesized peptide with nif11-like leader
MSAQAGLDFLRAARRDEVLRAALEALGDDVTEDALVAVARDAGFAVDANTLREAHALDWQLRAARYAVTTAR